MNASDYPIYDTQIWYYDTPGVSGGELLGTILPRQDRGTGNRKFKSADEALAYTILAFRDAEGIRWVRMPDGLLKEQACPTP